MLKQKIGLFILLIIAICSYDFTSTKYSNSPKTSIREMYHKNLKAYSVEVELLSKKAKEYMLNSATLEELQAQVNATRSAYKKIEFMVDYLDPSLTNTYINGAPLPKLMKKVPEVTVINPNGLQTIDEMVYLSPEEKSEIWNLTTDLKKNSDVMVKYQLTKRPELRIVIESVRYGILRVFTLGLTGFDTPGSVNAIPESITSLVAMKNAFETLKPVVKNEEIYTALATKFDAFIGYLKEHDDFDNLDRMYVLRTFVNPLYKGLLDFHQDSGIELNYEVDPTLSPHNYMSESIFDEQFFNASYYTKIADEDLYDPQKVALGKTLFYDPIMSKNIDMACVSCHHPDKGFTDGLAKSKSNKEGFTTKRNAPTLINASLYDKYFWDMREYNLERQVKHVVSDHLEFDMDFIDLADRLKESEEYLELFSAAYGDRDKYTISTWSISNALAAYVNSLTSFNSKFDQYARGESQQISENVTAGFNLFMGKAACGTCHFAPSFSGLVPPFYKDAESEVLGITTSFDTINPVLDNDPGRIANGMPEEEAPHYYRSIKTATVRNAELTGPYMHNGAFNTLEEVVEFYNLGGGAGMGLDVEHQTLPDAHLNLTEVEKSQLIAFMNSLTDTIGMTSVPTSLPSFENHEDWNSRLAY